MPGQKRPWMSYAEYKAFKRRQASIPSGVYVAPPGTVNRPGPGLDARGLALSEQRRLVASRVAARRALRTTRLPDDVQRHVMDFVRRRRVGPLMESGEFFSKYEDPE